MLSVLSDCMTLPLSRLSIFRPLPHCGQFVGGHHPGPEAAGAVEILAHVPLRGAALIFADRAFVEAGPAGNVLRGILLFHVLGAPADHRDQLGFIIERLRHQRPDQRRQMRRQRGRAAHEDGGKFRDVVGVAAFLHVLHVIEPETDDLARARHRQSEFQSQQRAPRGGRCLAREIGQAASGRHYAAPAQGRGRPGNFGSAACRSMT